MADIYIKQADAVKVLWEDTPLGAFCKRGVANAEKSCLKIIDGIKAIPPADVRPAIHSRWVWDKDGMDWNIGAWRCERCKARPETMWNTVPNINPLHWSGSKFCGNCGADMRGEQND